MKLAEALAERADCQVRIEEVKKRLLRAARVQEGENPPEDTGQLLAEVDRLCARLEHLISSINRTNAQTAFDSTRSVSDAIASRDVLAKKRDVLIAVTDAASTRQDRYSKSEVKFVSTVSIATLQQQIDALAKAFRETDTKLQELNWKTELL